MTIADRVYFGVRGLFDRDFNGNILNESNRKKIRIKIEKYIETYGGKISYAEEDPWSSTYDLFGVVQYTFFDQSTLHVEDISCYHAYSPRGNAAAVASKFGKLEIAMLRLKYINLPGEDTNIY